MLGSFGACLGALALGALGLQVLFGISWLKAMGQAWKTVSDDYRNWSRAREELTKQIRAATAGTRPVTLAAPLTATNLAPALSPNGEAGERPAAEPAARELPPEVKPEKQKKDKHKSNGARAASSSGPYVPPSIDLLPARKGDASTGWLRLGSLVLALAALAAVLINRRLPG